MISDFLISPFPDRCLLVHLYIIYNGLSGQQLSLGRVKVSKNREMENQKKNPTPEFEVGKEN